MKSNPLRLCSFASLRLNLTVYGFYLLVAVIVTWPLVTVLATRFIGHPFSDSYEYARLTWWFTYALQTGQSPYFQPWLAYPDGLTSWLMWSIPLQSFPAWLFAFVMPLPAALNVAILLRLALNGWAMFLLVRRLTGQFAPALLAGVIFLAYPSFQGQLAAGHTGLLALWPVVLYVYSLQSLVVSPENSALGTQYSVLSTALFFVLSVLGSNQLLIYLLLPITAVFALLLAVRREWPALRRLLTAAALGAALALVFILPGLIEARRAPPWLQERGDVTYSADLLSLVTPSYQHPIFGQLDYTHTVLGVDPFEKPGYIGLAAGALALIGAWRVRAARRWLLVAAAGWVLSLGPLLQVLGQPVTLVADGYPTYMPLPWSLYQQLPVVSVVRVPARFHFAVAFAVAIMAGYGWGVVSRQLSVVSPERPKRGTRNFPLSIRYSILSTLILMALVLWDYQLFWTGMPTIPAAVPPPIAALAQRDDVRAVFDVPYDHLLAAKEGLYLQTAHHKPLIAGQVTRRTPVNPAKLATLQNTLDPALLNAAGVDVIILHKEWDEGKIEPLLRDRLGAPFYEDERFAAFDAPETSAAPGFVTAPLAADIEITDRAEVYFYTPDSRRVTIRFERSGSRPLAAYVDGQPAGAFTADTFIEFEAAVAPGYHTLALAVEPPCPVEPHPALRCRGAAVSALTITPR